MYEVRRSLESLAEGDYKKFNEKIVPGAKNMLGVRLPKMREIAKARAKHEPERYFNEIEEAITSGREDIYYEDYDNMGATYHNYVVVEFAYGSTSVHESRDFLEKCVPAPKRYDVVQDIIWEEIRVLFLEKLLILLKHFCFNSLYIC